MGNRFLDKFRRITDSTRYLPEVDGLRFLAIFAVVMVLHIPGYMNEKIYGGAFITNHYWSRVVLGGGGGVSLFFMISGFILSLPFARWRLKGHKPVALRHYYLRRITRLEPPYLVALLIFFAASVWIVGKFSFSALLPHLLASALYLHTVIYHSFSWVLPVAWSLEVEVQFYAAAPLLFSIFLIRRKWVRWIACLLVIIPSSVYWHDSWTWPHLFKFIQFFFCGILLADLYCCEISMIRNRNAGVVLAIAMLAGFVFLPSLENLGFYLLRIACMFLLFHLALTNELVKKFFSLRILTVIGGMCYSIYLLHFAIISLAGQVLLRSGLSVSDPRYFVPIAIMLALVVLACSALYFLFVEKPFMRPLRRGGKI